MYSPFVVKVYKNNELKLDYIPEDIFDLKDIVDDIKKRYEREYEEKNFSVASAPREEAINIFQLDKKYTTSLPSGVKTIPVYSFNIV